MRLEPKNLFTRISKAMNQQQPQIVGDPDWDGLRPPRLYVAMAALLCGLFFSVMDGTVCNVALPTIAQELRIAPADSIWIVNSFQLVIVMMLLPFASLGELIGYRKVYLWGLVLFTSGSLACGLADTFAQLVTARVMQGVGAAMVMSISTSLIRLIYPKRHLGKGIGLNATVVALGLVVGPTFTGAVLSYTTWQWLFIINVPFGVVAWLLARRSLPDNPTRVVGRRFDPWEALLNALTFGLFILCFEAFGHDAAPSVIVALFVAFFAVLTAYLRMQQRKQFPMLPLDLLRISTFSLSVFTSIVSFASQMLAMVSMPFLLTHTFGYDAAQTGLLMTSYPVVILFVAPLAGFLIDRINPEILGGVGLMILCVGSFLLALMPMDASFWDIAWRFGVCGVGFGFFQSPNNHLILTSAPPHRTGSASGMMASARLIGQTLGAAFVALFFELFGDRGPLAAMFFGGVLSLVGMVLSILRLRHRR